MTYLDLECYCCCYSDKRDGSSYDGTGTPYPLLKFTNTIAEFFRHSLSVFNSVCQQCYQLILIRVFLVDLIRHRSIHQKPYALYRRYNILHLLKVLSNTKQYSRLHHLHQQEDGEIVPLVVLSEWFPMFPPVLMHQMHSNDRNKHQ